MEQTSLNLGIEASIKDKIKESVFSNNTTECPQSTKENLSKFLAKHTVKIYELLELDSQEIDFGISTEERVGKGYTNRPALNMQFDEGGTNPKFSILFPQQEIEAFLKLASNPLFVPAAEDGLLFELSHELHHIKQFKDNFDKAIETSESYQKSEAHYLSDEGEVASRIFAIQYLAQRDIPIHDILRQNNRLMTVLGAIALEGYARVKGLAAKQN